MRYIIIGAGAIGSSAAAELHLAGIPVVLIARGEHGAVIRERGLRYVRPSGERLVRVPVAVGSAEVELTADDVLVIATKGQHTEAVLQEWSWRPAGDGVAADLPVVCLQNGLDNERAALRRFRTVFGVALWHPVSYVHPGEVVAKGAEKPGLWWMGRYPSGGHPALPAIAEDFRTAGFVVQEVPDVQRWKAGKLLSNVGNAVNALYGDEKKGSPRCVRRPNECSGRRGSTRPTSHQSPKWTLPSRRQWRFLGILGAVPRGRAWLAPPARSKVIS